MYLFNGILFILLILRKSNSMQFKLNMGTKTAYDSLSGEGHPDSRSTTRYTSDTELLKASEGNDDSRPNGNSHVHWPSNCQPVQINGIIRHGIRNAGEEDISIFMQLVDQLESTNIKETHKDLYTSIVMLKEIINTYDEKMLILQGKNEQHYLGSKLFNTFQTLLYDANSTDVHLVVSSSLRTIESCDAFISSWLIETNRAGFNPQPIVNDTLIRFFDHCRKYVKTIVENKIALKEYYTFMDDNYFKIANKLKDQYIFFKDIPLLSSEYVKTLYIMAGLEIAALKRDKLAHMFTEEEINILEYGSDLKHYWKKSYGHEINYRPSCAVLIDIIQHMEENIHHMRSKKAVLRFAHAETLLPVQALLGLYKDAIPLQADNYNIHKNRKFRASHIVPFSSNLLFVLYECDVGMANNDYMVHLLMNEKPVMIPGCEKHLCPFKTFKYQYQHILDSCNFDQMCTFHDDL